MTIKKCRRKFLCSLVFVLLFHNLKFSIKKFGFKSCTYKYYLVLERKRKEHFQDYIMIRFWLNLTFWGKEVTTWMLYIIRSELWYIIAFIIQRIKISEYYTWISATNKNKRQNSFSEVFVSTEQEHSSPWTIDEIPI